MTKTYSIQRLISSLGRTRYEWLRDQDCAIMIWSDKAAAEKHAAKLNKAQSRKRSNIGFYYTVTES
jgi:hypothetical protein